MKIQLSAKQKAIWLITGLAGLTLLSFQNCAPEGAFRVAGAGAGAPVEEEHLAAFSQNAKSHATSPPKTWEQDLPVVYVNDPKQYDYEP